MSAAFFAVAESVQIQLAPSILLTFLFIEAIKQGAIQERHLGHELLECVFILHFIHITIAGSDAALMRHAPVDALELTLLRFAIQGGKEEIL